MAINVDVLGNTQPLEAAVQSAVNRIRRRPIKITVDDKGATQPLGNMRRSADEFSKSMEAANARIIAFGASMAIINGVADAFKGMVRNVVEVEKALADINVVMGLSAQNLERFSDGLFTVAKETGQAFKIAADAATEYARQGLSMEESLKRTKDALILTRLTGMDSANAVKSLTAAMNTYGNQIKDTTQLVSKFAAVDVKFAVSAEDFADAIARTGAAAKGAGVDIDELIGLVTAAQQQTARGGKVIGNSFKTIFTRIGRTDTLNQLENLGIAVRDVEGNTLGAKRILTDLANTFDSLTEAQKAQIAQTVGGVFQINVLKAVLGDAAKQNGILANATQISAGATDEAITKNEQLRQTMAAMATETGLAIKEVSAKIGEIALAPGMEKILNVVKSVAEGANNLLGDGESAGNKFANGFLKGLGNIITGPGLVVIVAVFGKLFLKAAQYARESLTSLIGVTTEAQKQKAIQTSLVNLFGQNAALSKEMLRTDISRTEKEKIILSLLRAQVAEANTLNAISKQAASTLYRQGFGPNLAPRRGRADGHIPNFAEREQAARGGYAAGNIRTMNMPGQGSVIYNSAEKVKNFAGMKQPAIMPPLSSKAGKNYQQAFGSVHGFDPYAGSGFVPNFDAGLIDARHVATMLIPFEGFGRKLSGGGKGVAPAAKGGKSVFGQKINSNILFNMLGVKKGGYAKSSKDNQGKVVPKALSELGDVIGSQTVKIANQLNLGNDIAKIPEASGSEILKKFLGPEGGRSGAKGAISGLYGAVFEEALSRRLKTESTERDYMGGDFDVRMATPELKKLFGPMAPRGDYKISDGRELQASMSSKIAKEVIFRGAKGSAPKLKMAQQMTGRSAIRLGGTKGGQPGLMSDGHVPNFANPLADAINREKGAGVPVSQIRVGSHQALMNKGNPLGLGVTNTTDEPNGLRDVFGANGYVPNYAFNLKDAIEGFRADENMRDGYLEEREKAAEQIKINTAREKRLQKAIETNDRIMKKAAAQGKVNNAAVERSSRLEQELNRTKQKRIQAEQRASAVASQATGARARGRFAGMGMMAMMGLPMAAGFLQSGGPGQTGSGAAAYTAGGAMTGAASGAMMASMVAPFLGPAAPIAIGLGGVIGALHGLTSASEENTKALKEIDKKTAQELTGVFGSIPITLSEEQIENVDEEVGRKIGGREFTSNRFAKKNNTIKKSNNLKNAKARRSAILTALENMNIDEEIAINAPQMVNGALKRDEQRNLVMTPQKMGRDEIAEMVKNMPIHDEGVQGALEEYFNLIKKSNIETSVQKEKERKAIILNLNLQKAIVLAQQQAKAAQIDIKQKYFEQANMLDAQTKILGGLISEENKARVTYSKSLLKNAETREAGEQAAEDAMRLGILQDIKASQGGGLQQALKSALFAEEDKRELKDITFKELTDKLDKKSAQQLLDILLNISKTNGDAKEISEQRTAQFRSQVDILDKQKALSDNIASAEYKTNDIIGRRKDLMKDVNLEMQKYIKGLDYATQERNIGLEIQTARFNAGPVRSQQEIFRFEQEQVAARQQNLSDEYTKSAISEIQSIADKLGLTEKQRLEVVANPDKGKLKDSVGSFYDEEQSRFNIEYGRKMKKLRGESVGLIEKIEKGGKLTDSEKQDMEELSKLIEMQNVLSDTKQKTLRDAGRISKELEDQLDITKQKINKEAELQAIKEKEYLRKTGPGAAMEGFRDGMTDMRNKVAIMDYELTKNIPQNFANGLANAMTQAINGAKDLDDALRSAAVNFLSMIQQALAQKLAMGLVGTLPFSKGGGVKKYSSGGNVPAMVTNGEYVMGRDAVKKYGGGFMHSLNARGKIPNYSMGGDTMREYGMGKIPKYTMGGDTMQEYGMGGIPRYNNGGRAYQSMPMSGFFYSQRGIGLQEQAEKASSIEQERVNAARERLAEKERKKQEKRQLMGMLIGTVATIGLNAMFSSGAQKGFFGKKAQQNALLSQKGISPSSADFLVENNPGMSRTHASQLLLNAKNGLPGVNLNHYIPAGSYATPSSLLGAPTPRYYGGLIKGYQSGGMISGKSGIDQIPAMLSEGEYVIKASSARQLGKPMLDRINAGKYYDGGEVGKIKSDSSSENQAGDSTNNINISINVEKTGNTSQKSDNSSGEDSGREMELAQKIKNQVLSVIVEEKRTGGLLNEGS